MRRGRPNVTFTSATPAKWKVLSVICVPGSPKDSAVTIPIASPGWIFAYLYFSSRRAKTVSNCALESFTSFASFFTSSIRGAGILPSNRFAVSSIILSSYSLHLLFFLHQLYHFQIWRHQCYRHHMRIIIVLFASLTVPSYSTLRSCNAFASLLEI